MADLNALARKYRSGEVTLEQLKLQYKLSTSDIEKIKQINAKIDKELCVKDNSQPLPGSTEITLDDGTKVLAAKIRTVNQPKGGFVNVYMAQDGKQYYQYTDANGKQQKISTSWNYLGATLDNFTSSIGKMADGHPIDGLVQMFSGAEDPRCLSIGEAPAAGFAKGTGWLSKLKDVKSWSQLKNTAMNLISPNKNKNLIKQIDEVLIKDGHTVHYNHSTYSKEVQDFVYGGHSCVEEGILNGSVIYKSGNDYVVKTYEDGLHIFKKFNAKGKLIAERQYPRLDR